MFHVSVSRTLTHIFCCFVLIIVPNRAAAVDLRKRETFSLINYATGFYFFAAVLNCRMNEVNLAFSFQLILKHF